MEMVAMGRYIATAGIAALALMGCQRNPPQPVEAVGTLSVLLPDQTKTDSIDIPDAKITLFDNKNVQVGTASTELDGHFRVTAPNAGTYRLCWDIQGRSDCIREVKLVDPANYLGILKVRINDPFLYGRVLTGDQRPCWIRDPFFKLDVSTQVDVLDVQGNAAATPVRANVHGDYLLPLKTPGVYQLHTQCELDEQRGMATVRAGAVRTDLALPNHAPRIVELAARSAGKGVVRVAANTPIELAANVRDRDGDTVEYWWRDEDGQTPAPVTANLFTRNAAAQASRQTTYLMARDGRGGYTFKRFDLEVSTPEVQFAGTVVDEITGAPIANATVQFGAVTVTTNARGWFNLSGPSNADNRYVVNVRHQNYALLSRVFDRSFRSNVFELSRAQVTQQPVTAVIDVVDRGSGGTCGGDKGTTQTGIAQQPAATKPAVRTVEYVDPEVGDKYRPLDAELMRKLTAPRQCLPVGARIILPADALVTANGNKATGVARVAVATLDPTRRALPGDARAVDKAGKESELLSYGAVYAELRDSSDQLLNLRAGTTAEVHIPVPFTQRSSAKPAIDFWSYDETTGKWKFEGQAVLKNTAAGPEYVGKTTHFSYLNMDVAGNDPATATCLRFEIESSLQNWSNLRVRATVSYNGNQVITKETSVNTDQYHAIYRIPYGTSFPPNTVRLELFGTYAGQSVTLVDNVINTDARPKMTGTDLWPPSPYEPCGAPVVLAPASGVVPQYSVNSDASNRPYFLTGPSGAFLPTDGETVATDYYAAIGATANKPTLGQWWQANGFDQHTGAGGTRTSYLNHNDLGFGRDMHCLKTGNNMACYVTNYGGPNQAAENADAALNQDPAQRGATVAMEYTSGAVAEAVQFYVYGNTGETAGLLKFADLDGFGPKPVPHLCLVCHGGSPTLTNNKAQQARFREFDLPSFRYPNNQSWDYGQGVPAEINMPNFGTLNHLVHDIAPTNAPIRSLIGAWYPANNYALAPQKPTPPAGWSGNATDIDGYHEVYGKTCRTCHIARDGGAATVPSIVFNTKDIFDGKSLYVCNKAYRVMPNAIITYKNFWTDTQRVNKFELLMNPAIPLNTCQND